MASISGSITIGEAQATVGALVKRQRGSNALYVTVLYSVIILAVLMSVGIAYWVGWDVNIAPVFGVVAAYLAWYFVGRRYVVWQFRKKLMARGVALHLPVRIEISSEALVYERADVVQSAKWSAISELYRQKGYWIFMVHSDGYYLPGHFFPNTATERAFITEALSYMTEEARARSKSATLFVEAKTT